MSYKAMLCFRLFCMCLTIQCLHDMTSGVEIRALCKTPTNLSQKPWQKHVLLHAQGYWHPETGLFILVLEIVMLQYAIIQLCTSIFGKMGCCFFFQKFGNTVGLHISTVGQISTYFCPDSVQQSIPNHILHFYKFIFHSYSSFTLTLIQLWWTQNLWDLGNPK